MEVLAIIPARGGSKGIPKKNIRPILNKPLLAYSIEHAVNTPTINRTVVSTDDAEIGAVAVAYGAEVVWRPADISGDTATSESALAHTLAYLGETEQYQPDAVVFLQATSPLRQPDDLQNAIALFEQSNADSLFSSCAVEGFTWRTNATTLAPVNYNPTQRPRRQDLTEFVIEENGSLYIFKPWILTQHNSRLGGHIVHYPMSRLDSFQVDVPEDLALISTLLRLQTTQKPSTALFAPIQLLILDFDGVFTDNTVIVDQNGVESVTCNRGDGWGIARLRERGLEMLVLSTERNPVVAARCRKLQLPYIQGSDDKLSALRQLAAERNLTPEQIAYVGNDVNDSACMAWVGLPIAVADAVPEIKQLAHLSTQKVGGKGAVREVAEWFLQQPPS